MFLVLPEVYVEWRLLHHLFGVCYTGNGIQTVTPVARGAFSSLTELTLNDNNISSWQSIDALQTLSSLAGTANLLNLNIAHTRRWLRVNTCRDVASRY